MLNMQNVKDIEIPEGDVRTIHDKDNRLIWGRLAYDTKYAGDTFQQTYSGKNLLAGNYGTNTQQGIRHSWNNVYVTLSGTTSGAYSNLTSDINAVISAGTYTFSTDKVSQFRKYIRVRYNGANHDYYIGGGETSVSFTIPNDATDAVIKLFYIGNLTAGMQISETFGLMLESGSSASPFEPYTAGPAPNPDYPQDIQVVTGAQTVTIGDGASSQSYEINLGKNLWNPTPYKTGYTIGASGVETVTTDGSIWELKNVSANTTFTISSKNNYVYSGNIRVHAYNSSGSWIEQVGVKTISANTSGSLTFTTPANTAFLRWGFWSDVSDAQLELGSTATPYAPYFTPIELCKIGDYQDYIYQSEGDWYVHKAIDTQEVDTSNMSVRTTYTNLDYAVYSKSSTSVFYDNYNEMDYPLLCSHARHFSPGNFNTTDDIGGIFMSGQKTNWWIGFAKNTSLDTMKANLNNCKLYSPLATPTDTKITDATLVGQLNAVHEWLTRYGYNATVTGNLPIIINQTNL